MSSLLSAELAATCSALGYYDEKSNKYYADSNTLETVKDLIRYLRRDDESHDIRRQVGEIKVLTNDLIPLLKSYWEEVDLFDVLLRLLVNLTTPALMLWNEQIPTDKTTRNHFLQIEDHLKNYKETFADENFWAVVSTKLGKILETNYAERGDENSLIIERILILIRNILYVPPDPVTEKRPDYDASIHDQVLWALHQSGMLDIILYITSSSNEKAYYMHTLEILSFLLKEQRASELARAALQRTETEKMRDEAELLAIRHRETKQRQQKVKMFNGARHSRFGGTYVMKSMKSISDNDLIYHKPLNKVEMLNFDIDKKKPKTPKNRLPLQSTTFERRSAFSVRLVLKEFCVEFLNGAYNTLMYYVKDNLARARAQAHDESYYLWALRFFMEFNRCYKFEVKLVSETMSVQTFRYVQQLMEKFFDMIQTDKSNLVLWSRRLHLALLAYKELLYTICAMDKSDDKEVRDSSNVIKSNIFYILEYREFVITLLLTYDELKMSNAYLTDLMETQHVFINLLESFCKMSGSVVVQKKGRKKNRKKKVNAVAQMEGENFDRRWDEIAPQLSTILEGNATGFTTDIVPFDAASDVPIDEQKSEAMINVQRKLRNGDFESSIGLLRAAREVWPENNCFGSNNMAAEEEFAALREIFFADLGENDILPPVTQPPICEEDDEDEEEDDETDFGEMNFKFEEFVGRLANPKVVKACGLALRAFETNSVRTNNCVLKLLHRIAFDCKMYVMVFQVSIFRTFQRIYANKEFPQYRELLRFATYIIRQFEKIAETNKKVYMETLFWKNQKEVYEIEHGYGNEDQSKTSSRAWTEEQEDELRRLFMEHQQNQHQEDVVDWIVDNLIDNTRTRRNVLKKLKEMCLLVDNKGKSGRRVPQQWSEDEETQLRELYQKFKEAADPLGCIMARLDVRRSKVKLVQKLLDLGLIQDRREVRKRRTTKNGENGEAHFDASGSELESDESDREVSYNTSVSTKKAKTVKKTSQKRVVLSDSKIASLLIQLVNKGMTEALDWLKESFSDAIEDFESDDSYEGIPLVPIMDYSMNAMEDADFQAALKALGVTKPSDEQETYWRIPGDLSVDTIKKYIEMLQQAIDNTLTNDESTNNEEENAGRIESGDENETEDNAIPRTKTKARILSESEDEDTNQLESHNLNVSKQKKSFRKIIDSDSESEDDGSKRRADSDSGPTPKRLRIVSSDEE